ncbi:hypothetical protein U0070_010272 [Myodes glareolus]|uniref:G-protein coupled receptors family 1 profile domain-containing protein n=1 Tax=Myodes glareolus TaxID=447135 RepID=A0AAW0HDL1_MYOGA
MYSNIYIQNVIIVYLITSEDSLSEMDGGNQSVVSEFMLLGLAHSQSVQVILFVMFLVLYLLIVSGNIIILILITTDSHLHSPMYFLLANLSFVDMWLSSITTPKMISDFLRENKTISFAGCMSQVFFAHCIAAGEMVLLVVMAYDRYVAICKPLHYFTIMNLKRCIGTIPGALVSAQNLGEDLFNCELHSSELLYYHFNKVACYGSVEAFEIIVI